MHCSPGAASTGTTRSRCSPRCARRGRSTRSRSPTATPRGWSSGTTRQSCCSTTPGCRRTCRPRSRAARGAGRGPAGPGVRPAHARGRPARPHAAAPSRRRPRSRCAASRRSSPASAQIVDDLLDALAAAGPDAHRRPGAELRVPAAVHRHLRAARRARARPRAVRRRARWPCSHRPTHPSSTRGPRSASDAVVAQLNSLVDTKERAAGRRPRDRARSDARDGDERLDHGELLSTLLPADHRRARHDDEPARQRRRRAAAQPRPARHR